MQQGTCNKRTIDQYYVTNTWTSPQNMRTPLPCNTRTTTVTQPWYHDHLKWTTWNTYVQTVSKTSQQRTNIISTGRTITLYTARWKSYLCGMDFVKRFEHSVHSATEHADAPIFTPHNSLGDLWHPPVNLPRATKHAPMSQVTSKNEHTAPSSPPLSPEETPWKEKNKFSRTFSDIIKVNDIVTGFSNRKPL